MSEQSAMQKRARIAGPERPPTFDADVSVAAAVLKHVTSLQDRLRLACVSRVWKDAAATEGGVCDVVIEGELAKRLTDERFKRVMDLCGDVKRLEVRGAPEDFQGLYFYGQGRSFRQKFANLETLILTGCRGLDGSTIVDLMEATGMRDRPKHDRLERLHLAGSKVFHTDAMMLPEFVRVGRLENYLAYRRAPLGDHEGVDLWGCATCCGIFDEGEGCQDPTRCARMEIEDFGDLLGLPNAPEARRPLKINPCDCGRMRRAMKADGMRFLSETWGADMCPSCTRCYCDEHQRCQGHQPLITPDQINWDPQTLRERAEKCGACMSGADYDFADVDESDFDESDFDEYDSEDDSETGGSTEELVPPFRITIRDITG